MNETRTTNGPVTIHGLTKGLSNAEDPEAARLLLVASDEHRRAVNKLINEAAEKLPPGDDPARREEWLAYLHEVLLRSPRKALLLSRAVLRWSLTARDPGRAFVVACQRNLVNAGFWRHGSP